ncbi:uncharacterized protein LOC110923854 [Helianthus annuus]|uniref:uncharacterized protein LOC110923854 n=1 Tax=Helianthus annuus TaxID=4232 RepID=UPI000B8FE0DB|nr:uncharacterized protein LOC110923854 [Helianthus annuus]
MEYQGDTQVKAIKLQVLRREFENLSMKDNETVSKYFSRDMGNVSQKRAYGEIITDQTIVEKILRSLSPKFDHIVPSIEVSLDLSKLTPVKLMGSLQSQEERINSISHEKTEKFEEHALQVMQEGNRPSNAHGRGLGVEPKENNSNSEDQYLFMAVISEQEANNMWFLDSGCSNHITGSKVSFVELDETFKMNVQLGNKKTLVVEGKGVVRIYTGPNSYKLLSDVYYALTLEYNLLSVGQLMRKGYSLLFKGRDCTIKNQGAELMKIHVSTNNMFVVDASKAESNTPNQSSLLQVWHKRYGHLNWDSLKLLHEKAMVSGLPQIKGTSICEGCILAVNVSLLLTSLTSSSFDGGCKMLLDSDGIFDSSVNEFSFLVEKNPRFDPKLRKGELMILELGAEDSSFWVKSPFEGLDLDGGGTMAVNGYGDDVGGRRC